MAYHRQRLLEDHLLLFSGLSQLREVNGKLTEGVEGVEVQ